MKTLDVCEKYISQHVLAPASILKLRRIFKDMAEFSEEYPGNSGLINEWVKWLRDVKKLSDITTHRHYIYARSVAKYVSEQYDLPNPFLKSTRPHFNKKPRRYFSADQIAQAIRACTTDEEKVLIMALVDSGCRIQDLAGLKGSQVTGNSFTTSSNKKTGSHTYRLDPNLCKVFKSLAGSDEGYVFKFYPNNKHNADINMPAPANALGARVRRILIRAGFKGTKLGAHTFRHSTASLIAKTTKSALAVKGVLGHADLATSMSYIHDSEQELAQEISPLKIVAEAVFTNNTAKQAAMLTTGETGQSTEIVPVETEPSTVDTLISDSYPIPVESTSVTPTFNYDELLLIRRAFIALNNGTSAVDDPNKSRILWRRMLRKAKFQ